MNTEPRDVSRRGFLQSTAGATAATACANMHLIDRLATPAAAAELKQRAKRVIVLWLAGGASQLETFDPKPGRPTGGPFQSIATDVPGVHISELMPQMAKRMKHTAIVRSLNTKDGSHGSGARLMHLGRRDEPNIKYPEMGSVIAHELAQADSQTPDFVSFYKATEGRGNAVGQAGYLGARYAPMFLTEKSKPDHLGRLDSITDQQHAARSDLRAFVSRQFAQGRKSSALGSHNEAYARVRGLMASEKLFDVSEEPDKVRDRYGRTLFGEQALIARRLIEAGTPFVKVGRAWWDSHGQNFETHLELVPELDQVMSALIDDLEQRGLLEDTLVVTLSEFGRTPKINASLGRDHFASAWSVTLTGCGIQGGAVYGKTDEDGQTVAEDEVGAGEVFATIYEAVGIPHDAEHHVGARPIPLVNPGIRPINAILKNPPKHS